MERTLWVKAFIGTQIVTASEESVAVGGNGYRVLFPDGHSRWISSGIFELLAREITTDELAILAACDRHNTQKEEKRKHA